MSQVAFLALLSLTTSAACDSSASFASVPSRSESSAQGATSEAPLEEAGYGMTAVDLHSTLPARSLELESRGAVHVIADDGESIPAVHVSVSLSSTDDHVPWTLDADTAKISIAGDETRAFAASLDRATLPIVLIAAGERQTVDLYFWDARAQPLDGLPKFEFSVRGSTGSGSFEVAVTFVRGIDGGSLARTRLGDPAYWWFDAGAYAWPRFEHQGGIITPRLPTRATVVADIGGATTADELADDAVECAQW